MNVDDDVVVNGDNKKKTMLNISISFLYVNLQKEIHKIITEKYNIDGDGDGDGDGGNGGDGNGDSEADDMFSLISKESLLSIMSSKLKLEQTHYKLIDILLFHIPCDEMDIPSSYSPSSFLHSVSFLQGDLTIPPSLPLFHSVNSLIIIFQQIETVKKPSLKISSAIQFSPDEIIETQTQHLKTRKRRSLFKHTRKLR